MYMFRRFVALLLLLAISFCGIAFSPQFVPTVSSANEGIVNPAHWSYKVVSLSANEAELQFQCKLDEGWHVYSVRTDNGGPIPTSFVFTPSKFYSLQGTITEPKPHEEYDELFGCNVRSFQGVVTFKQKVRRNTAKEFDILGTLSYQLCNNGSCIPPNDVEFMFHLPVVDQVAADTFDTALAAVVDVDSSETIADTISTATLTPSATNPEQSLWVVFVLALLGGLLTMITPCVFPMIPMTVNYFVRSQNRRQAWLFGGSIVFIFAVLGAILTLCFGPEALYFLGTHWLPNLLFFAVFVAFSLSFFGLFELRMPSRWVNGADSHASQGGWVAPCFMALTTVLVSFSCTGPILGAALVGMATSTTNALVSLVTMVGFGVGFAAPFTLLALFPSLIKGMKSGAWLNTVKVSFAFLELAFGLKFLSMADLYCGWHLIDREVYLALWIVIFALLGFYLLGKLRFKGDSEVKEIGVVRLFLVILDFAFVVYMIPGMWGAPLKAISGFLPPMETQDFNLAASGTEVQPLSQQTVRYGDQLSLPAGFSGFFDLDEAKQAARKQNKPIFIDFTGKTCANCREMEHYVWADPTVQKMLNNDFVVCALYVDANYIELPQSEWVTTPEGKVLKTLGRRNLQLQKELYKVNAQPYYVIIDADGNTLTAENYKYNRDPRRFELFLKEALSNFRNRR